MKCREPDGLTCCACRVDGECVILTDTRFKNRKRCPFYCTYENKKAIYLKKGWSLKEFAAIEADKKKQKKEIKNGEGN